MEWFVMLLATVTVVASVWLCLRQVDRTNRELHGIVREHQEEMRELMQATLESERVIQPRQTSPPPTQEEQESLERESRLEHKRHLTMMNDLAYGTTEDKRNG